MTIFNTPFDTTACHGYVVDKIQTEINKANVSGWLEHVHPGICLIQQSQDGLDTIPSFSHPLVDVTGYRHPGAKPDVKVAIDMRPYGKWDKMNYKFIVTAPGEYALNLLRARLTYQWLHDVVVEKVTPRYQRDISPLPMSVYASWLSEGIQSKFALQPTEQYRLQILAGIFYYTLFENNEKLSEDEKMKLSNAVSRNLKVVQSDVLSVIDAIDEDRWLMDIKDFCKVAARVTGSVRLQELTVAVLYAIVGSSWFHPNAREWLHTALEHPPTWLTIVYATCTERGYRNSGIGRITERAGNQKLGKDFVPALIHMVNDRVPLNAS